MQKMILFITGLVCLVLSARAQLPMERSQNPVSWHYRVEKIGNHIFRLHMTANIQPGWHLYSQHQPENAIAIPTHIEFKSDTDNVIVTFEGQPTEEGKVQRFENKTLGISALQYSDSVDFVQNLKLGTEKPVVVSGSITYQACRDKKCLRPVTATFNVTINRRRMTNKKETISPVYF